MTAERIRIVDQNARQPIIPQFIIDFKETPNQVGQLAMQLVQIAMHTGKTISLRDHYQETDLLTAAEVAKRCCDVAQAVFDELRARGMMVPVPSVDEMRAKLEAEGGSTNAGFNR